MKKKEIILEDLNKTFTLLKEVHGKTSILVKSLASEYGVKITDLMNFIVENDNKFLTDRGGLFKNGQLFIKNIYLHDNQNPLTLAWLRDQKASFEKYLFIQEYNNYGRIEGYYIQVDQEKNDKKRESLWRNTEEKIKKISSKYKLKEASYYIGGFGDSVNIKPEKSFEITLDVIGLLRKQCWIFNEFQNLTL